MLSCVIIPVLCIVFRTLLVYHKYAMAFVVMYTSLCLLSCCVMTSHVYNEVRSCWLYTHGVFDTCVYVYVMLYYVGDGWRCTLCGGRVAGWVASIDDIASSSLTSGIQIKYWHE